MIRYRGQPRVLGSFDTSVEAAAAHDEMAIRLASGRYRRIGHNQPEGWNFRRIDRISIFPISSFPQRTTKISIRHKQMLMPLTDPSLDSAMGLCR